MAEGFASSRVEPMVELSTSLVALNDAVSPRKLEIIKLVAKHAFGVGQQDLDDAHVLTSVHTLLEQKHDSSALNILIMILMRLDIDTVLVGALKKHVKQNEIVVEGYQKMDFILTVSCILRSLHKRQYESLKEMARRTFLNNYDPSNIKSRTHLLQLLFDQNCLTPNSFLYLFAWLEVVGCSRYHSELKAYCRRHNIKVPEWDSLVPPLKEIFPTREGKYDTHPRSCPRSFPATVSLPAAMRDGGMIDSQSLSLRSKPTLPFPNSGGRKSDLTPSPTVSYMYRESTEHPVEASGPTAMVTAVRGAPNSEIVLVPGHQEKALGTGSKPSSHQLPVDLNSDDSGDESNDESGNSTELHHPQSESSQEGYREGKFHVDKWPSSNLPRNNERMTNVVGINDDTSLVTTMSIDFSQIMTKGKEQIRQLCRVSSEKYCQGSVKYCCCYLLFIIALVVCIGGVSGGVAYHYIGPSPGDTSVTLAQNATVNIGCFNILHIGHFIISAVAQTAFKFLAVPSSSVVATNISFPVVSYKRAGADAYTSLNYYHIGYFDPLYSANSGTLSYDVNFTNFDSTSCFHLYLFNSFDLYHEVLKNLGPASGYIKKFFFCPNSTHKVFKFTFRLPTVGFYYVAAFMSSDMSIDVRISAEIFTYDITYLEGLGVQSCLLDDGKCLLQVGHHPVHAHSESVCILASSSSQLYGKTINGTVSPQRYLFNAGSLSTFIIGSVFVVLIIIVCPCIFCKIKKFCASRKKSRDGYVSL